MISSLANPQVKNLCALMKKSKLRRENKCFIAEGIKMFLEAPVDQIEKAFVSEQIFHERKIKEIPKKLKELEQLHISVEILSDSVFKAVSDTVSPQGIICIIRQREYCLHKLLQNENPLFILLEDLQDPGNLGTIMRTAEGAGVTAVIMSRGTVDLFNPKTIRSTMGSVYRVPYLYIESLEDVIQQLSDAHIQIIASCLKDSIDYTEISYQKGTAFLIGNESAGLSDALCEKADARIKIPMQGKVESLNAAVAAAIMIYEAYRQRR